MNEQDHLADLKASAVGLLRAKINAFVNSLAIGASDASAKLLSLLVIGVLALNIFCILNLSVGFLLGELFGSYGLGFLALVGFYTLLLIIYMAVRPRVEESVQDTVAWNMHGIADELNSKLNSVEQLQTQAPFDEVFISAEPYPYKALVLRRDEAIKQSERATRELRHGVQYVKQNYVQVFGSVAQQSVPAYRYIAPIVGLWTSRKPAKRPQTQVARPNTPSFLERKVGAIKPYMPFISTACSFLYPVVSAFVVGRTQSWLLAKLLGRKKKRK